MNSFRARLKHGPASSVLLCSLQRLYGSKHSSPGGQISAQADPAGTLSSDVEGDQTTDLLEAVFDVSEFDPLPFCVDGPHIGESANRFHSSTAGNLDSSRKG